MSSHAARAVLLAVVVTVSVFTGVGLVSTPASAAPSVGNQKDIASHSDSTSQSATVTFDLPPKSITCTFDVSQMKQYGVTVKSVSSSGSDKFSIRLTSSGKIEFTIESGSGTETVTITITMSTEKVQIPDKQIQHKADCTTSSSTSSRVAGRFASQLGDSIAAQQSGFTIQETGIQNTSKTKIHGNDSTITNDTTLTQSVDLDLLVPDDGDSDGDTYNVTIDTREARAAGINVTGASIENDPSGSDALVEVVGSPTVTDDENVTLTIREASADRSNGNISQETITVGLELDATQHGAGEFKAGRTITHTIRDEAGNTTAKVSFQSNESTGSGNESLTLSITAADSATPNSTTTVDFNLTNVNETTLDAPAINVTGLPANWTISSRQDDGGTWKSNTHTWVWLSISPGSSKTTSLTLEVPNGTAAGNYTVTAKGSDASGHTATATATITVVNDTGAKSIDRAIAGSDGMISLAELQNAIQYWSSGETVPDTGGKTISLTKLQSLIQTWASGKSI